jgi:hypothetical protein
MTALARTSAPPEQDRVVPSGGVVTMLGFW